MLNHQSQQIIGQAYYSGHKDSEKLVVRQLPEDENLLSKQVTLDAIYLNPLTVKAIHGSGGRYLIGLKANQPLLYRYAICATLLETVCFERADEPERGHGRVEQR